MKKSKKHWMKFYPSDWRSERRLKLISRAARSLWLDIIGLMHEAGTGRLEIDGRPMTEKELAATLGDDPRTIKRLLKEIEDAGVSSRTDQNFLISRRISRDIDLAEVHRENGKKGGNPNIKNKDLDDLGVNPQVKAHMLEARGQRLEEDKESTSTDVSETRARAESQSDDGVGFGFHSAEPDNEPEYAFHGKVIRLNSKDLALWKKRYHGLLDIEAELFTLDGYYATRDPDGGQNWFYRTQSNLLKRHNEGLAKERNRQRQETDEWGDPI